MPAAGDLGEDVRLDDAAGIGKQGQRLVAGE
jgi:hypothetical protein